MQLGLVFGESVTAENRLRGLGAKLGFILYMSSLLPFSSRLFMTERATTDMGWPWMTGKWQLGVVVVVSNSTCM